MGTVAQLQGQIEVHRAARAHEQGRPVGGEARPVRRQQEIRLQQVLIGGAEALEAGGADLLPHLDQDLQVEAQFAARSQNCSQ